MEGEDGDVGDATVCVLTGVGLALLAAAVEDSVSVSDSEAVLKEFEFTGPCVMTPGARGGGLVEDGSVNDLARSEPKATVVRWGAELARLRLPF